MLRARLVPLALLLLGACSKQAAGPDPSASSGSAPGVAPTAASAAPPSAASSPSSAAPVVASSAASLDAGAPPNAGYPVGQECSTAKAIAEEKRKLPPAGDWTPITSKHQRLTLRVPAGVFVRTDDTPSELRLVSSVKAKELGGPGAKDRPFAIRVRRVARSADSLLADTTKSSPLGSVYVEDAFQKRTLASFKEHPDEPVHSGFSGRTSVAGHPGFVWVNGVEGYNTDQVLVPLAPNDTLLIAADWNSSIMIGQPECWQRAIIGGVVDSITLEGAASK